MIIFKQIMRYKARIKPLAIMAMAAVLFTACDRDNNNPGYTYFPDMDVSVAYDTYNENPNFEDGKTLREPVEGTIPRDMIPYPFEKTEADMIRAGKVLSNPYEYTDENVLRGKILYERFCEQCHGSQGDGQGQLFTMKLYPFPPASLIADKVKAKPDGEIYHNITVGFGIMGAHGPLVLPEERWKIVMYIRDELQDVR